jgi:DNA-binding transcriptional MerR regulator
MPSYDFLSLDDKEFEQLALRLLGAQEGIVYERFKPGKDGGIDGRYFSSNGQTIVQCKHWARSGLGALLRALRNDELPKVQRLKPARYVLVTSLPLSPANKAEIRTIFHPYVQSDADVLGCEAMNDILALHPAIERGTIKLWLHSAAVLSQFASLALVGRSAFVLGEMRRKRARYVETASHKLGVSRLTENHVVLITGEPGVGKTTLAEQLCLDHVLNGFQLCAAAKDVEELEAAYREDAKQVFYFDDFLGRTFLEAIGRHEDSHIIGFIKRIRSDKSKRLVLTSRTTILNRGKSLTDLFRIENVDRHELELKVGNLSALDKARILHSCVWHSRLSPSYVEEIVRESKYMYVIAHRNFNPRLVSFITDPIRLSAVQPSNYWSYVTSKLDNPSEIWGDVYDQQMSEAQRIILLLVVVNGGDIPEQDLLDAYRSYLTTPTGSRIQGDTDYQRNIQVLIGSLLNRTLDAKGDSAFDLFNPSIADFALPRLVIDGELMATLALALKTQQMIRYINRSIQRGKVSKTTSKTLGGCFAKYVLSPDREASNALVDIEMLEVATQQNPDADVTKSAVVRLLTELQAQDDGPTYVAAASPLLRYGVEHELLNIDFIRLFLEDLESDWFSLDDVRELLRLANEMPLDVDRDLLLDVFKPVALEVLSEIIDEEIKDRDILEEYLDENDVDRAAEKVYEAIADLCAEIGVEADSSEIDDLCRRVNIDGIIESNIRRACRDDDYHDVGRDAITGPNEIHDLFSMDLPPSS